jgi:hypothetical protein
MSLKFKSLMSALGIAIFVLCALFLLVALAWILVTDSDFTKYLLVLSRVFRYCGSYSTLLAALVATIAFQSVKDAEVSRKESEGRIKTIGLYTIAFQKEEEQDATTPVSTCGDIIAIHEESDFRISLKDVKGRGLCVFPVQFLTSGEKSTNLTCLMAFEDDFFSKNKKKIIANYYAFCEKVQLQNPLYCAARQTNPDFKCEKRNRFINLALHAPEKTESPYKFVWVSAIADQGFLFFIKVKVKVQRINSGYGCQLIAQFRYYVENKQIKQLYS